MGSYNAFLETTLPLEHRIYDPDVESLYGPPMGVFKFRHWGYMEGPFKGHPPHCRRIEFFGVRVFHVDEDTKVEKAEFFYERGNFLASFLSVPATSASAASASGCLVMRGD
ncbi:hypothetical protein CFC21_089055 [Triticum aestivum]|uniref:Uncharacterized protein n=2 Tax=Triticum aestivum TaxID=4565 RepID=A0A9R1ILN2_WHEAT|nr:hypothetical protein CFC21_089055 [Triticum aestivum]